MNPEDQSPFWKPKFLQTAFVQIVSALALFDGKLDQGGFVTISTMIFAMFTAASVIENKIIQPPMQNAS